MPAAQHHHQFYDVRMAPGTHSTMMSDAAGGAKVVRPALRSNESSTSLLFGEFCLFCGSPTSGTLYCGDECKEQDRAVAASNAAAAEHVHLEHHPAHQQRTTRRFSTNAAATALGLVSPQLVPALPALVPSNLEGASTSSSTASSDASDYSSADERLSHRHDLSRARRRSSRRRRGSSHVARFDAGMQPTAQAQTHGPAPSAGPSRRSSHQTIPRHAPSPSFAPLNNNSGSTPVSASSVFGTLTAETARKGVRSPRRAPGTTAQHQQQHVDEPPLLSLPALADEQATFAHPFAPRHQAAPPPPSPRPRKSASAQSPALRALAGVARDARVSPRLNPTTNGASPRLSSSSTTATTNSPAQHSPATMTTSTSQTSLPHSSSAQQVRSEPFSPVLSPVRPARPTVERTNVVSAHPPATQQQGRKRASSGAATAPPAVNAALMSRQRSGGASTSSSSTSSLVPVVAAAELPKTSAAAPPRANSLAAAGGRRASAPLISTLISSSRRRPGSNDADDERDDGEDEDGDVEEMEGGAEGSARGAAHQRSAFADYLFKHATKSNESARTSPASASPAEPLSRRASEDSSDALEMRCPRGRAGGPPTRIVPSSSRREYLANSEAAFAKRSLSTDSALAGRQPSTESGGASSSRGRSFAPLGSGRGATVSVGPTYRHAAPRPGDVIPATVGSDDDEEEEQPRGRVSEADEDDEEEDERGRGRSVAPAARGRSSTGRADSDERGRSHARVAEASTRRSVSPKQRRHSRSSAHTAMDDRVDSRGRSRVRIAGTAAERSLSPPPRLARRGSSSASIRHVLATQSPPSPSSSSMSSRELPPSRDSVRRSPAPRPSKELPPLPQQHQQPGTPRSNMSRSMSIAEDVLAEEEEDDELVAKRRLQHQQRAQEQRRRSSGAAKRTPPLPLCAPQSRAGLRSPFKAPLILSDEVVYSAGAYGH